MERTNEDEMAFSDMTEEEFLSESERNGGRKGKAKKSNRPPRPYDHLTWEQYEICRLRERFMAVSVCAPFQWMEFVRLHQEELSKLDEQTKASFRRVLQGNIERSKTRALSFEDMELINKVFGPYTRAVPPRNLLFRYESEQDRFYGNCKSREPTAVLQYMHDVTYNAFYRFMHCEPEIDEFIESLDSEQEEMLRNLIEYQCMADIGPISKSFRHFEGGDYEDMISIVDRNRRVAIDG